MNSTRKKQSNVNFARNAILAAVVLIIGGAVVFAMTQIFGGVGESVSEGDHYTLVEDPRPRRDGEPIVVREFFSYGCVHCKNFDPMINDWAERLPDGVRLEKVPVTFQPQWTLLARAYYALLETDALAQNNERLFRAIHDNRRVFQSLEEIAEFVDGNGITTQQFLSAANAPKVDRRVRQVNTQLRRFGIQSVPSLVVDDRYVVNMAVGRQQALDVAMRLIEQPPEATTAQ